MGNQMDKSLPAAPKPSPAAAPKERIYGGEPTMAALVDSLVALRVHNGNVDEAGIGALIERIGLLNIVGPRAPGVAAAFDLSNLLAALPDPAADEDLTEMVIKWLDDIFSTCPDEDKSDGDDVDGYLDMEDGEADELPANLSPRTEVLLSKTIRKDLTCDPKEVFPPPPLEDADSASESMSDSESECSTPLASDDDSVATVYSPSVVSLRRFDLKRRYGDSDLESSASEDEVLTKRRRRAAMLRRTRKPQRKFFRATPPPSSDEESYFSDSVHVARPMSPIDGQIAGNLAMYCALHSP